MFGHLLDLTSTPTTKGLDGYEQKIEKTNRELANTNRRIACMKSTFFLISIVMSLRLCATLDRRLFWWHSVHEANAAMKTDASILLDALASSV